MRRRAGLLLGLAAIVPFTLAAQEDSTPPGEWLVDATTVSGRAARESCLALPWRSPRETLSDSVAAGSCTVDTSGTLGPAWRYAIYRHRTVYAPDSATRPEDRTLFPDTLPEDDLVVFSTAAGDSLRPVWHDRRNTRYDFPQPPGFVRRAEGDFLRLTYCLNGTGGCWMTVFQLRTAGRWTWVRQAFAGQFRARLPRGWGTWKGIRVRVDSLTATAPLYVPGDGNCCPTFAATLRLTLRNDSLLLAGTDIAPERGQFATVFVPGYSAGGIGPETSLADLRRWFPPTGLTAAPVELGQGACTPGTVVQAGAPGEAEIAWADSGRTRVAFVRVTHRPSSWKTAQGVTVGTTLDSLVAIAGHPVEFYGWEWDSPGSMTWTEPVPPGLGRELGTFHLRLEPDSASRRRLQRRAATDARARQLFGDRLVRSDHPSLVGLTIRVAELFQDFAPAAIQQDCAPR